MKRKKINLQKRPWKSACFKMKDLDWNSRRKQRQMKWLIKNWKSERNWNEQQWNHGRRTERLHENTSNQNQIIEAELQRRTNQEEISKLKSIIKRRKITGENTTLKNASFKMRDLDSNAIRKRRKMKSREKNWKGERNWNEQKSNQGWRTERVHETNSNQNQISEVELRRRTNQEEISKLNNDN
jgi:hypothetical protein